MRTILLGTATAIGPSTTENNGLAGTVNTVGTMVDMTGNIQNNINLSTTYCGRSATLNSWTAYPLTATANKFSTQFSLGTCTDACTDQDYALTETYVAGTDYDILWRSLGNGTITSDGKGRVTFVLTVTALTDIVINELGLIKGFYCNTGYYRFLLGRVVLDEATELKSGYTKTFQVDIDI